MSGDPPPKLYMTWVNAAAWLTPVHYRPYRIRYLGWFLALGARNSTTPKKRFAPKRSALHVFRHPNDGQGLSVRQRNLEMF